MRGRRFAPVTLPTGCAPLSASIYHPPSSSCACKCPVFTPASAAAGSEAIARVHPLAVRSVQLPATAPDGRVYQDAWFVVRVAVADRWRGVVADTVEVWTPHGCGTRFRTDRDHLLFAHWEGGRLQDWSCRTKEIEDAVAELQFLEAPVQRTPDR